MMEIEMSSALKIVYCEILEVVGGSSFVCLLDTVDFSRKQVHMVWCDL